MDTTATLAGFTAPDLARLAAEDGGQWTVVATRSDLSGLRSLSLVGHGGEARLEVVRAGDRFEVLAGSPSGLQQFRVVRGEVTPPLELLRSCEDDTNPAWAAAVLIVEALVEAVVVA